MKIIKNKVMKINVIEVKRLCWTYLITALVYSFSGPTHFNHIFVLGIIFSGLVIFSNPPKNDAKMESEKVIVCKIILSIMAVYAFFIFYGSFHQELPHSDGPSTWIANRFFYLFGLAFFMPPLLEYSVDTAKRKDKAILIGCVLLFVAFYIFRNERLEISHGSKSWYSSTIMYDDILLSISVGLLVAVFTVKARQADEQHQIGENTPKGSSDKLSVTIQPE